MTDPEPDTWDGTAEDASSFADRIAWTYGRATPAETRRIAGARKKLSRSNPAWRNQLGFMGRST